MNKKINTTTTTTTKNQSTKQGVVVLTPPPPAWSYLCFALAPICTRTESYGNACYPDYLCSQTNLTYGGDQYNIFSVHLYDIISYFWCEIQEVPSLLAWSRVVESLTCFGNYSDRNSVFFSSWTFGLRLVSTGRVTSKLEIKTSS